MRDVDRRQRNFDERSAPVFRNGRLQGNFRSGNEFQVYVRVISMVVNNNITSVIFVISINCACNFSTTKKIVGKREIVATQ